ncbi:MAG TPA: ATP-dependent DNA helicase RecQ [Polyangia bacterium]|nr:ATP-dependent DNA helicase RecQ [Polyangia bacterium]
MTRDLDEDIPTIVIHRGDEPEPPARTAAPEPEPIPHAASVSVITPTAPTPPPSEALQRALVKMREVFNLRGLRPGQAEIMESVLAGRDTLAIMPTGSGKSLTYQLPALVLDGPTLVVSPLLALIEDQVGKLKAAGVPVARIDSTRTAKERAADLQAVRDGTIKLVLITPESINSPTVQDALAGVKFSLFCVDEAHCVSQWGHDFRPAYLGLRRAAQVLGRPPILGLTATATPAIGDDVLVQLGMKDAKVCRVSFHRPNLAFDVRKVAGEADKLRQLGKLIQRLRRPGIVYCSTVRAVDDLYVALRHGKIPVERYNGKMTTDEREKAQASFMQPGRKVVMLATNAFGLGVDKPDIRYIIHYQMPGSPESYVQEAGRAGRDGKPARCVLLFQPDDIAIQEHFLKEAHPTKSQARMVAEGLYAWSDEGKEVSVRDLALSMALPERRVRVILSVLEAMGVAKEVKAARWEGVEPKPTREQIDKAASVFEARRISDRRRLAALLGYMNTQRCRVQMMRAYFGEPEGDKCGLCDSCAGLDSEVFDPGSADERHGLHAATDFHARPRRRRRRGGGAEIRVGTPVARPAAPAPVVFETAIPTDLLPPLPAFAVPASADSESPMDERVWDDLPEAGREMPGDAVIDDQAAWLAEMTAEVTAETPAEAPVIMLVDAPEEITLVDGPVNNTGAMPPSNAAAGDFDGSWAAVRDANIRPYVDWRPTQPVPLPTMTLPRPPVQQPGGHPNNPRAAQGANGPKNHNAQGAQNGHGQNGGGPGRNRRRRRGRDRNRPGREGGGGGGGGGDRNRDRGPRLPGFYNPGGD